MAFGFNLNVSFANLQSPIKNDKHALALEREVERGEVSRELDGRHREGVEVDQHVKGLEKGQEGLGPRHIVHLWEGQGNKGTREQGSMRERTTEEESRGKPRAKRQERQNQKRRNNGVTSVKGQGNRNTQKRTMEKKRTAKGLNELAR